MLELSLHKELLKNSMERLAIAGLLDKKFNDDVAFQLIRFQIYPKQNTRQTLP